MAEQLPLMRVGRIKCDFGGLVSLSFCQQKCKLFTSPICPRRPTFEEQMVYELTGKWITLKPKNL